MANRSDMADRAARQGRSTARAVALALGLLVASSAAGRTPVDAVPAQDPGLPTVAVTTVDGDDVQAVDCLGQPDQEPGTPGSFTLTRTGPTTDALSVVVDYAEGGASLPEEVAIPAGQASATVVVPVDVLVVRATISTTAAYEVAGDLQTFQVTVRLAIADLACNLADSEEVLRIVGPGQVPAPIDLAEVGISTDRSTLLRIDGDQPPGTGLQLDGTWSGAPTDLGIYEARAYWCESSSWCPQELLVTVIVTEGDPLPRTPPTPPNAPPPARPVRATPTLTG